MTTKWHRPILLGSVAMLSVAGIAVAATTASVPAPETLWKEIGVLQKSTQSCRKVGHIRLDHG